MVDIPPLIAGSERLLKIFGYWPSFHDAEVLEVHFDRGRVRPEENVYKFPVLTMRIHVWELTRETNAEGFLILKHHTLVTLQFCDVSDFEMKGFNHQNAILELCISHHERAQLPSPYFSVEIQPSFGIGAWFNCLQIEVLDARPCREDGDAN